MALISMPNMTGRPRYRTMEMNGGSSAGYLPCTPCVPLLVLSLIGVETEGLLDYQGRAGDHFHWTVEASPGHIRCRSFLERQSGKKKAHKHKLFGPVALGTPRECPRDKPGLSPGQSGFVPGTNPGCLLILHSGSPVRPWDKPSLSLGHSGDEGRQKEFMC